MSLSTNRQLVAPDGEMFSLDTCFHTITAALSEGVIVYNADAYPLLINAGAERILGLPADELKSRLVHDGLGHGSWHLVNSAGRPIDPMDYPITMCLRTGQPCTDIVVGLPRSEAYAPNTPAHKPPTLWLSVNARPLHNPSGALRGAVLTFADITAQKQAEDRLVVEQDFFELAINNLPGLFYLIDASGRLVRWSKNLETLTGCTPANMRAARPTDFIAPEDRAAVVASMQETLEQGHGRVDALLTTADGSSIPYLFTGVRIDIEGAPHYIGMGLDISERKQYERDLVAAQHKAEVSQREAEEMNRLKSAFLANMSHELRTPLTSIIGFADLLMTDVQDEFKPYAECIRDGAMRLMHTLESVMELARLESQSVVPCSHRFDLSDDLRETIRAMRPQAEHKGLALELVVPDTPVLIRTDRGAVERICSSVLSNAIKFTSAGSVTMRLRGVDGGAMLCVEDTGIGIAPDFLPHIFDEFRQESMGLSRSHEGNGLGLAITRRLVDLLGGSISVTSTQGEGSVFTVFLPDVQDDEPSAAIPAPVALPYPLPAEVSARSTSALGRAGISKDARPCVLIVEDHAETRAIVGHLLRPLCRVLLASDAEEAIRIAEEHTFDLALIDINLSRAESGLDVLAAIKSLSHLSRAHLVALTAHAMPGDRQRFLDLGFDSYVSKPFRRKELLDIVKAKLQVEAA